MILRLNSGTNQNPEHETKEVWIAGMLCILEKRVCLGGCKKEFWVKEGSAAEHARSDCRFVCNVPIDQIPEHIMKRYDQFHDKDSFDIEKQIYQRHLFSKTNPKTKPAKIPKEKPKPLSKEDDPGYQRQKRKWITAIKRAKKMLSKKSDFPYFRESIAAIATAVVTSKKNFSIKCFSSEIGLDRKTLQSWINVKCEVLDQITVYNGNFLAARRTREFLKENKGHGFDLDSIFIQESQRCQQKQGKNSRRRKSKGKSNGSFKTEESGKIKIYRMKIKIKCVS